MINGHLRQLLLAWPCVVVLALPAFATTGPVLHIEPQGARLTCAGALDLRISNTGPQGTRLLIDEVLFQHGYSQGYYGMGFRWDLSAIEFPVVLERGAAITIPVAYAADAFPSRLHVAITSNAVVSDPPSYGPYLGELCPTPTPTPARP